MAICGPQRALQQVAHAAHQLHQVDRLQVELLAAGEGQHALGQDRAALGALHGIVDQPRNARIVVGHIAAQQVEAAQHHGQQIVEIVRHAAGQLADRLDLLRLHQRLARAVEGDLRRPALGDVARDLGEAQQAARRIADGVDHDVGEEARAVLAQPPRLGLEATLAFGNGKAARRLSAHAILLGVEAREMLADDLGRLIALDALGAAVPVADDARGIEHVDRVVGDAFHQPPEKLLAAPQLFFRLAPLGKVPRDLGKADQPAVVVTNGVDDDERPEPCAVLAQPPAVGFELALASRGGERTLREACRTIGRLVEGLEVAADDLFGVIPLDALGAGIPARHHAGRIDHVDRIVGHGLDEQAEALGVCGAEAVS